MIGQFVKHPVKYALKNPFLVIPVQAGIQEKSTLRVAAFVGVTGRRYRVGSESDTGFDR